MIGIYILIPAIVYCIIQVSCIITLSLYVFTVLPVMYHVAVVRVPYFISFSEIYLQGLPATRAPLMEHTLLLLLLLLFFLSR